MEAGTNLKMSALKKDAKRIKRAEFAITLKAKKCSKQLKYKSIDKEKNAAKVEGILYAVRKIQFLKLIGDNS